MPSCKGRFYFNAKGAKIAKVREELSLHDRLSDSRTVARSSVEVFE